MVQPPGRPPPTSVVIVSRHRPQALARCLEALTRQSHPDFEIVLVADPDAVGARPDLPLKRLAFDRANISEARNAGIALPVVAIGGITAADVENILATGVTGIALSGALLQAENTLEETQRIINIINRTKQ